MAETILSIIGFGLMLAVSVAAYFVNRLDKRLDTHDARDDQRFRELHERVDRQAQDATEKRHAFRNEVHAAINENFNRLYRELRAMEERLSK